MDGRDGFRLVLLLSGKYDLSPTPENRGLTTDQSRLECDVDAWMAASPRGIKFVGGKIVALS